jgi:hypothetical protein
VDSLIVLVNPIAARAEKKSTKQDLCDILDELDDLGGRAVDDITGLCYYLFAS